jgi:hypothetical protein
LETLERDDATQWVGGLIVKRVRPGERFHAWNNNLFLPKSAFFSSSHTHTLSLFREGFKRNEGRNEVEAWNAKEEGLEV